MPRAKYNVNNKRKSKDSIAFLPSIGLGAGRSGHILTSRPYGTSSRTTILVAAFFLLAFTLMSIYAVILAPLAPGAWDMLIFFGGLTLVLLGYEKNVFPDIGPNKIVALLAAWFLAFLAVPFLISLIQVFQLGVLIIALIFLLPLSLLAMRLILPDERWQDSKDNFKSKLHIGSKKVVKKAAIGVKGANRKRKIYRR
jgi:hypothetical protein